MMSDLRETTFTWTVENFDVAPQLPGESLESPVFSMDAEKKLQFSLKLYPRSDPKEDENHVSLFVKRQNDKDAGKITLKFEFSLIDASGKCTNILMAPSHAFGSNDNWGYRKFYKRRLLLGSEKESRFLDEKLTVRCRLLPEQVESKCEDVDCLSHSEALSQDFAELLHSGMHSDLTIQAEGKQFKVHTAILEARCPNLMSKLVKTMKLNIKNLRKIKAPALQTILHYIYTGILRSTENLDEVFEAASRFELEELKRLIIPYSYASAKTVIECFRVSFEWIIPDFKNFQPSNKEVSYLVISNDTPKSNWMKVSLLPNIRFKDGNVTMLTFEKLLSSSSGALHFKVHTEDANGVHLSFQESISLFENGKSEIPFGIKVDSDKLMNGNLKLHFDVRASIKNRPTYIQEVTLSNLQTHTPDVKRNWTSLHRDMLHFYKSMKKGDVILNVGSHELATHKAVLCSRSEVFCKMFQHDSRESQTNSVNIEDVDEKTMTSVLMYMYSGVTDEIMSVDEGMKMYNAADKYLLLPLKQKCCEFLKSNVNAENGCDISRLAILHSDEGLKNHVHEFMKANAREVLERGLTMLDTEGGLYEDILNVLSRCASLQKNETELKEKK